jgi:GT2 family glycosyltransferase
MEKPFTAEEPSTQHAQKESPLVWIVVLHFLGTSSTKQCLESLRTQAGVSFHVLLIDNGSPEREIEILAKEFPEVDFVSLPENLGFAGGCNFGFRYCLERGAEWVWFLNSDATVETDTLQILINQVHNRPEIAAAGPLVFDTNGDLSSGAGEIDFLKAKVKSLTETTGDIVTCDWLSGCALLVRSSAFKAVGGFDENYFLYFEDTDLCVRLRESQGQCVLVRSAKIKHVGNVSTKGRYDHWRSYYHSRNRMLFFLRRLKGPSGLAASLSIYSHLLRHMLVLPFRGEAARRQLKAELRGCSDYLSNKFGRAEGL